MQKSLVEQVAEHAKKQPEQIAIIAQDGTLSYGTLYQLICGFCRYLKEKGIQKGGGIVCRAQASVSYWVACLGTHLAGGIFIPLEKDCTQDRIEQVVDCFGDVFALISLEGEEKIRNCQYFLNHEEVTPISKAFYQSGVVYPYPDYKEDAVVLFTTGTTGVAKGVVGQHSYLVESAINTTEIPYAQDMKMVMPVPMNHLFGIGRSSTTLWYGGTLILVDGLANLKAFYEAFEIHGGNALCVVPSALNFLLNFTEEAFLEYAEQIRFIEIGGEKTPYALQEHLLNVLPKAKMYIVYASTETCVSCVYDFSKYGATKNRIGHPIDNTKIYTIDEDWQVVNADLENPGFLAVESPGMMRTYFKDEETTKDIMKIGRIKTSDFGYVDEEGFICLTGRAGDVIVYGGQKINPTEVEDVAFKSGFIRECVAYGVPDKEFGQLVKLLVVMKEGIAFNKVELERYFFAHVENFKVPKIILETTEIVRNRNGKIDRKYYKTQK